MSTDGLQPVVVDQYGGLCTLIDRSDLPVGLSPDCRNVEFFPGGVRSRSGFSSYLTTSSAATGLFPYVTTAGLRKLLILQTNGTIQVEYPEATVAGVAFSDFAATTTALGTNLRMRGTTLFGRAYFGLYYQTSLKSAVVGPPPGTRVNIAGAITVGPGPFQYDGTTIGPVGQAGPCACFTVTPSAGGTMSAGRHDFCVLYETSTGYVTAPSDAVGASFTAGQDADLAVIPIGPGNVYKRIIFATPANSTSFYTIPRLTINNNTATTLTGVTFTDSELMSGTSLEDFIDRAVIKPCIGVEKYGRRLVYWGGTDSIQSFYDADRTTQAPVIVGLQSLTFDERDTTLPFPWTTDGAGPTGAVVTLAGASLQTYRITGTGVDAVCGAIIQTRPNYGYGNVYSLVPSRRYGIRARLRRNSTAATGTFYAELSGLSSGISTVFCTMSVSMAGIRTDEWGIHEETVSSVPVDVRNEQVVLRTGVSGTLTLNGLVYVDWIEIFDLTAQSAGSVLQVTPPDDPEAMYPATGLVSVAEDDGQVITNVFELRGNLYICKEHSLYVTTDNGDEPYTWVVDQVSDTVGTPSPHGVAVCDSWAIIVSRNGCYYFTGGTPEKISQEIQPLWDSMNWGMAQTMWATVDSFQKRVYIGYSSVKYPDPAAVDNPDKILVLDYTEGFGDPIAGGGSGRKWTIWSVAFITGSMVERDDKTQTFLGASGTTIAAYTTSAKTDWSGAISSYYETAPLGMDLGRSLFDRVVMRIRGSGSLATSYVKPSGNVTALTTKTLAAAPDDDVEIKMHENQTQLGFKVGTTGATDYWNLRRLGVFLRPSAFTYLRKT